MKGTAEGELTRLIYISRSKVSLQNLDQAIESILTTAQKRNQEKDITGALLFNAGHFAQALEGPNDEVESLFEDIQADERHHGCIVLCCEPISERTFANWSMAYRGSDSTASKRFTQTLKKHADNTEPHQADEIFDILVKHILNIETHPSFT